MLQPKLRHRTVRRGVVVFALALPGLLPGIATADETPITVESSAVVPSTIIGGSGGTQIITLSRPAPPEGIRVWVSYDRIFSLSTGGSVVVPGGERSVTLPFRAAAPDATVTGTISAQANGTAVVSRATFTHQAADPATRAVSALRFSRTTAVSGTAFTGTVVLKYPAPAGGLTVSLWPNTAYGPASVYMPNYVTVPAGQTTVSFAAQATAGDPGFVPPSADLGTSMAGRELIIVPKTFALGSGAPRRNSTARLALGIGDAPNPSGTVVKLSSDNPEVKVPDQVTVPAGQPGVAVPYTMGAFTSGSPWPKVTATWNGQSVTALIIPQ